MTLFQRLTMDRLMIAILFLLMFAMAVRVPVAADTWWHLRSGEYIVEEGVVPQTDPFSHTRLGETWIDHSWGAQVVLYGIFQVFGGGREPGASGNAGLALYTAVLATAGMAVVYLMCEGNAYLRAFAVMLGATTAAVFWSPRPHMMSFLFSALILYVLYLYKYRHLNRLWLLPVLMLIWANMHGGFAIGFVLLAGFMTGEMMGNLLNPDDTRTVLWPRLRAFLWPMLATGAAVAVNPYGMRLFRYPLDTVRLGVLRDYVEEWASPSFHEPAAWPFLLLLIGVFGATGLSNRRIDWTDLVLVSGTLVMALTAGRNIAVFALVATPVLSRHVNAWLVDRGWQFEPMRQISSSLVRLNWLVLLIIAVLAGVKIADTLNWSTMRAAQAELLPVEAAAFVAQNPLPGAMFNSYNWGGYLIFAAPDVPVYVDGRTDVYGDRFLREYVGLTRLNTGWSDRLRQEGIGFVVIEAQSVLAAALRERPEQWREHQLDDGRSAVFVRVSGEGGNE